MSFNRNYSFQRPSDCCIGSDVLHSAELTDCKADYPDESGDASGRSNLRRNPCIMDCYFNKTGIFKDGEPVKAVALDVLGKAADADITALLNDGIDKCIEIQKNVKSKMKESAAKFPLPPMPDDSDRKRCRPDAKMFSMCVQAYIFSHCPVEKLVSSAECAQLSQFHQKCMPQLPK